MSFEVELQKIPGARLGMDLVLVSSPLGTALVVEKVTQGIVDEWNRRSTEPYRIRPGDFISKVNRVEGDVSALASELRSNKDLVLTVERASPEDAPQVWQSVITARLLQQQQHDQLRPDPRLGMQAVRPDALNLIPGGLESAVGSVPRIPGVGGVGLQAHRQLHPAEGSMYGVPGGLGFALSTQAPWAGYASHATAPPGLQWPESQLVSDFSRSSIRGGAADVSTRSTFEALLYKPPGAHLGIDVLTYKEFPGLSVQRISKGGVVDAWNSTSEEPFIIHPGDAILRVNGIMNDAGLMMEELRARTDLHITVAPKAAPTITTGSSAVRGQVSSQPDWRKTAGTHRNDSSSPPNAPPGQAAVVAPRWARNFAEAKPQNDQHFEAQLSGSEAAGAGGDGQYFVFEVEIEKPPGAKMGIDVMLVTGHGLCGLVVEKVNEGGCVDLWNKQSEYPRLVQPGDCIVSANGISSWKDLARTAEEFASDAPRIRFTLQRSPHGSGALHQQQSQQQQQSSHTLQQQQQAKLSVQAGRGKVQANAEVSSPPGLTLPARPVPPGLLQPESKLRSTSTAAWLAGDSQPSNAVVSTTSLSTPATASSAGAARRDRPPPPTALPPPPPSEDTGASAGETTAQNSANEPAKIPLPSSQSKTAPTALLLSTLQLNDKELTSLLRVLLHSRPWLLGPVKKALLSRDEKVQKEKENAKQAQNSTLQEHQESQAKEPTSDQPDASIKGDQQDEPANQKEAEEAPSAEQTPDVPLVAAAQEVSNGGKPI